MLQSVRTIAGGATRCGLPGQRLAGWRVPGRVAWLASMADRFGELAQEQVGGHRPARGDCRSEPVEYDEWHEHDGDLFCGTERFFRPGYIANLVPNWIPALEGVEEKLTSGGLVADVAQAARRACATL
jgi:hypothetical protein